jgi:hypothetical protein
MEAEKKKLVRVFFSSSHLRLPQNTIITRRNHRPPTPHPRALQRRFLAFEGFMPPVIRKNENNWVYNGHGAGSLSRDLAKDILEQFFAVIRTRFMCLKVRWELWSTFPSPFPSLPWAVFDSMRAELDELVFYDPSTVAAPFPKERTQF